MENSYREIDTSRFLCPETDGGLRENRSALVQTAGSGAEVTILIVAWNRLEKTRRCVESILRYTEGIDYELMLVDNGSTDGTLDYFLSVPREKKRILRLTKNLGTSCPLFFLSAADFGDYVAFVNNDLIVTQNWLKNTLACMKSDPRIGMANPVSNNTSNLQRRDLPYSSYEEMQSRAAAWNVSDPRKWEDRLRLLTLGTLYRKEVLLALGWPLADGGFFHDFGDDDIAFAVRRAGYRTVLAGDTWICHDHNLTLSEGKDPAEFRRSLDIGRRNFQEKYFGLDAWDDVNNYWIPYLEHFPAPAASGVPRILGVDVRCGSPILDVKNWLRKSGIFDAELSAFTRNAQYWLDLKTICRGRVACGPEEALPSAFPAESFDYVIADCPFNQYGSPWNMLDSLFALCRPGGIVALKLRNTASFYMFAHLLGQRDMYDEAFAASIPLERALEELLSRGAVRAAFPQAFDVRAEDWDILRSLLPRDFGAEKAEEVLNRMLIQDYVIVAEKR